MKTTGKTEHAESGSTPITDAVVKAATCPPGKTKIIINDAPTHARDKAFVSGFGLRVSTGGAKTFVLRYRQDGRDRLVKIGAYGPWSVLAARERAAELRRIVDAGGDPAKDRAEANAAPTVGEVFDRFFTDYAHKLRASTLAAYKAQFKNHIKPSMGKVKIAKIEHAEVQALHNKITRSSGGHMANRVVALLSRVFNVALRWNLVDDNPARGIERNPEAGRKRYLTSAEVQRLMAYLPKLRHQGTADAIRLLMYTGARRMEVLSARWEQFDLEAKTWTKPASTTKQKSEHRVPLAEVAVKLLERMRDDADAEQAAALEKAKTEEDVARINRRRQWLFPAVGTEGHQGDLKTAWATIRDKAQLPDVRVHDLRHSFASFLASNGASLPLIGAMLGHSQAQTTQRYAHLFDDAQRAAADKVGNALAGLDTSP